MSIAAGILFVLVSIPLTLSTALGLPGTWLVIAMAALVDLAELSWRDGGEPIFGIWAFVIAIIIAGIAEVMEFLAGAAGAKAGGASRRGMVGALVGGFVGGIVGTFVIPIPFIGTLIGAALGAAGGALIGEMSKGGVSLRETVRPATGAAAGRVAGTVLKLGFAVAIWIQLSIAAFV